MKRPRKVATEKQTAYILGIKAGLPKKQALLSAGYSPKHQPANVEGSETVALAVATIRASREDRQAKIEGAMAEIALGTMGELMGDTMPPGVRFSAAKWMMEAAGHGAKDRTPPGETPLHEMTTEQLQAFIAKAEAVVAAGGDAPVITLIESDDAPLNAPL